MKTNFTIEENIYLKDSSNKLYDLHNDYNFMKYEFNCNEKKLLLIWEQITDKKIIIIEHLKLNYLLINNNSFDDEMKDLCTVSYFSSRDRLMHDSITINQNPEEDDDIIYFFENENVIRLNCAEIVLKEKH